MGRTNLSFTSSCIICEKVLDLRINFWPEKKQILKNSFYKCLDKATYHIEKANWVSYMHHFCLPKGIQKIHVHQAYEG